MHCYAVQVPTRSLFAPRFGYALVSAYLAAAFRLMLSWVDAVSGWNPRPTGGGRMLAHRLRAFVERAVAMPWEMVDPITLYMV